MENSRVQSKSCWNSREAHQNLRKKQEFPIQKNGKFQRGHLNLTENTGGGVNFKKNYILNSTIFFWKSPFARISTRLCSNNLICEISFCTNLVSVQINI